MPLVGSHDITTPLSSFSFVPFPAAAPLSTGDAFIRLVNDNMRGHAAAWSKGHVPGWPTVRPLEGCSMLRRLVGRCPETPHPFRLVDGSPIYSETQQYCAIFLLSGLAVSGPGTMVVEMGTLLGHSSRCLAQGLAAREPTRRNGTLYAAFDFFSLRPALGREHTLLRRALHDPRLITYEGAVWRDLMVRPVYNGPLQPVPGDIEANAPAFMGRVPRDVPIEVWSIDSAKSHKNFVRQAAAVWPRLRVGSVVHLVDNLKQQAHFVYAQFVRSGELEVAYLAFGASPWSFVVRRPLDWQKVAGFHYGLFNASEWAVMNAELEALVHRFARTFGAASEDVQVTLKLLRQKSDHLRLTKPRA